MGKQPTEFSDLSVEAGGIRLNTRRRDGQGPTLLLLHGIGGALERWAPLLAALPDRDVLMIDAPGAGRSQVPTRPIRVPVLADRIVEAAHVQGIETADVLGFSLGGTTAQEIAHRHPQFVRRLVLVVTMSGAWFRPPRHG
ncbi:MAG: alpha/beta fold hydrolase [Tetrasphaera sp.]